MSILNQNILWVWDIRAFHWLNLDQAICWRNTSGWASRLNCWKVEPVPRTCRLVTGQQPTLRPSRYFHTRVVPVCMAAMSSLGRLGLSSRRGLILISNSKSTMVRSEPFTGSHLRGLATTVRRDERFFTKKHEWVEVEGTKGECQSFIIKISS